MAITCTLMVRSCDPDEAADPEAADLKNERGPGALKFSSTKSKLKKSIGVWSIGVLESDWHSLRNDQVSLIS